MSVLLDVCGSFLPDGGRCQARVITLGEIGDLIEGECEECGAAFAIPTLKANPRLRQQRRLDRAGLPSGFAGKRFEETPENRPALEAIRGWLASFADGSLPGPALWGDAGRGKTHLLVSLCRKLISEQDVAVLFRPVRALLRELQSFDDEQERRAAWERAVSVDVLVLDDLGAQQQTDWRHDQLADLVDERYMRERSIVLATNFPPSTWPQMLDARTASRLRGMTFSVELKGPDRRVRTQREEIKQ